MSMASIPNCNFTVQDSAYLINPLPPKLAHGLSQNEKKHSDNKDLQNGYTDLIEDPLWKYVYTDALQIIGASAQKIKGSRLGQFSTQDKTIYLYCQTEEVAQFIQQYDFILLGSLQRFFPALRELKVAPTSHIL